MSRKTVRVAAALALLASLLGLTFSAYSTFDYAAHLDRQVHDLHCSLVPGRSAVSSAETCRDAMYSPYSAVLKRAYWGGIPISLLSLGAFCFFAAGALYLLLAGSRAPRWWRNTYALAATTPTLVSLVMLYLSVTRIGGLCRTCVGIYLSSVLLLIAAVMLLLRSERTVRRPPALAVGTALRVAPLLLLLALATVAPSLTYASTVPDHTPYLTGCGKLKREPRDSDKLLDIRGEAPLRPAVFLEDPLCPTCRALHGRLEAEGIIERLDARLVLLPLDSECNWMLAEPLHPGACQLSRAILCAEETRGALDWAMAEQKDLAAAGARGPEALDALILERLGPKVLACSRTPQTRARLNKHLHFAAENNVPVSTPQVYLGDARLCDEDTDLGLSFALHQLAPEVLP